MQRSTHFVVAFVLSVIAANAGEVFIEAENFQSSGGWSVINGAAAKSASGLAMLNGATGDAKGTATTNVSIKDAGRYHIWVRFNSHPKWRGPFHVTALAGDRVLGDHLFDDAFGGRSARDAEVWQSFDVDLPEGGITLRLSKHENKNSPGISRLVDCLLLTMDDKLVPNHLSYGAQTWMRVTLGDGYARPAYIHIFADHFHAPWYQHYSLGKAGAVAAISPKKTDLLASGESTPWCNVTPLIFQDSGAMLHITARHGYTDYAGCLRATFEIATAPDDAHIVRTLKLDNKPGTTAIFMPPNLLTPDNVALCKTDSEIAEATGKLADAHDWPRHGKARERFPFFVSASIGSSFTPPAEAVLAREQKTLGYFGFSDEHLRRIGGAWLMKDKSYCNPDTEKMRAKFKAAAAAFQEQGGKAGDITYCELTDEPTGQDLELMAKDESYARRFVEWLKSLKLTPEDLLVKDWSDVKIVTTAQRNDFPALYLYSQRFRTRALGDFMATQRKLAEEAYGGTFPVLANFSDGAVYVGNFCAQGVDYFELLDSPDQNAIWGEDWSNGASTYQCASFNVDLMRAAARDRGQVIGHHLVAHANRKPWDIKLKATSEAARGVKIFNNFCYGPTWATHEGGPYWRSHVWQGKPETWTANAAITREIGAVEDMLLTAMPAPGKVALLYSSSSDAWTIGENLAHGFERMHTWLALAHAQMPADIVSERQAAAGALDQYSVCYLAGPNLARVAADNLKRWVQDGGTLWLAAGAAMRDEFNRPLHSLDDVLPVERGDAADLQKHLSSGRYIALLSARDEATWEGGKAGVLSVRQPLTARAGTTTIASFKDGAAALVKGGAGKGTVFCAGFLPALSYIKTALDARNALQKKIDDHAPLSPAETADAEVLERTYNPWAYPADVRDLLLLPAREAKVTRPIECDTPLVDAIYMPHANGIVVPLANYTARPISTLRLKIATAREVASVESAVHGAVEFRLSAPGRIELSLPLENNDFIAVRYR